MVWVWCQGVTRNCSICSNDNPSLTHPVQAMFDVLETSKSSSTADLTTWWQSVTWHQLGRPPVVTISLSFNKMLQLQDDLVVVFKSARPQHMVLEKSVDFGRTWSPLQYYNRSCRSVSLTLHVVLCTVRLKNIPTQKHRYLKNAWKFLRQILLAEISGSQVRSFTRKTTTLRRRALQKQILQLNPH